MARIHINGAGEPGECRAEKQCPFGGDDKHYDSVDAARAAYEKKMNVDGLMFKPLKFGAPPFKPATEQQLTESRDKAKIAHDTDFPSKGMILSASDKNMLQKVLDGKKVPDAKLDEFLDRHFDMEMPGRSQYFTPEGAKAVFDHLRLVRAQSQTPSTLTRLDNFDPSTQSVFSADARKDPNKMAKALKRSLNEIDHLRELADKEYWLAENYDEGTPEERKHWKGEGDILIEKSKRAEVRSDAMLTELKWKIENDKKFAAMADPKAVSATRKFRLRSNPGKFSVGTVRKVTDE